MALWMSLSAVEFSHRNDRAARRLCDFLLGLAMLFIEHPRPGAPGTLSLLAPDLGGLLFFRRLDTSELGLDFIQQDSSGQETIERLGAFLLALDPDTRWPVIEHHTG